MSSMVNRKIDPNRGMTRRGALVGLAIGLPVLGIEMSNSIGLEGFVRLYDPSKIIDKERINEIGDQIDAIVSRIDDILKTDSLTESWYIQYGFYDNKESAYREQQRLEEKGISNVKQVADNGGIRLVVGNFAALDEAVKDAEEKLTGMTDEVGIVKKSFSDFKYTLTADLGHPESIIPFDSIPWQGMPIGLSNRVDELVHGYNRDANINIDPAWIKAIMTAENSTYDPNRTSYKLKVVTKSGNRKVLVEMRDENGNRIETAFGLMMLAPITMRDIGLAYRDRHDPDKNLRAGINYFGKLLSRYGGDFKKSISAYNAGPTAVDKFGGMPPFLETQRYVTIIEGLMRDNN